MMTRATAISWLLSLMAIASSAGAADIIVMDARGVALKPGQVLDDAKVLDLDEGQKVTLVTASGDTLKLKGPYHQPPVAGPNNGNSLTVALSSLVAQRDIRTSDVGVVRAGVAVHLPEPWLVDVGHPGNRCVREGAPIIFWREQKTTHATFSIETPSHTVRWTGPWQAGSDRQAAPPEITVSGRATFLVNTGGGPVAITLINIPATLANDRMRIAWMFEKGCNIQAETLSQTLK